MSKWLESNKIKLIIVVGVYAITTLLLLLPYVNLIKIYIPSLPTILCWILICFLFHPRKNHCLIAAFVCFLVAFLFTISNLQNISEIVGEVCYLLIATCIIISLKDTYKV